MKILGDAQMQTATTLTGAAEKAVAAARARQQIQE
jgi:hypothetical protein